MEQAIYEELKRVARAQSLTTFGAIAPLVGLNLNLRAHREYLALVLRAVSIEEHREGRPLLSAIVVQSQGGTPGKRFFKLAKELGLYSGCTELDELEFFSREVARVHATWK